MFQALARLSEGNPGALSFLMQLLQPEVGEEKRTKILDLIESIPSLRGTNIYVLWSDLCERNTDKVYHLCKNCPPEILEDACSRQDYSGRKLVKEYLEDYEG